MKYHIITYGCQMNKSDSERIAGFFGKTGSEESPINKADLIVVNMCSVRQSAVDRIYGLEPKFKELRSKNPNLKTVLTGCVLKKDKKKFSRFFNYILNVKDLPVWQTSLALIPEDRSKLAPCDFLKVQPDYSTFPIAYIPISTGCNYFCTYCVVPQTRGQEVCRPVEEILSEVENLVKRNYKEIWLLGQKVNSYRFGDITFAGLVKLINDIPGRFWLRFTSPHPKDFSDEIIKAMAQGEKTTPYTNLPVQSGDDGILKKMKRNYTVKEYKEVAKKLQQSIPDISLSTDIIVGFPGESENQFENTRKLMEEIKFDMAYISQFSPRPGTVAGKMKDDVPKEEKRRRERILTEVLKKHALEKNKKFIGETIEVLPTGYKNGYVSGKSFHYKSVKFKGSKELIGSFVKLKITKSSPFALEGELAGK